MRTCDRIKMRREQLGMTVDDLAEKIGKNRATIYRYESGEIENMPLSVLAKIADALCCKPAWLMGWDDSPKNDVIDFSVFVENNPEYKVLFDVCKSVPESKIDRIAAVIRLIGEEK